MNKSLCSHLIDPKKISVATGLFWVILNWSMQTSSATVITTPVGPQPPGVHTGSSEGYLVVYSRSEQVNDGDMYYYPHSSYEVYQGGRKVETVINHIGIHSSNPERAALPPGQYTVVADSENDGEVKVPVIIKTAQTTVLHLENGYESERTDVNPARGVKTPSGQVIGWSAK